MDDAGRLAEGARPSLPANGKQIIRDYKHHQPAGTIMPRTERIRYIHNFTPEERVGLYGSLSDSLTAHETAEEEKSSVVSDFNSKIKMLEADIHATNRKLRDGYEERETEAGVTRDAKRGKVFYHDLMTGELLLERDMTGADYQFTLDDDLPSDDE